MCSHKPRPYKNNIQQINGSPLLPSFDTQPLCNNIIVAYGPHALRPQREWDDFYAFLNNTLSKLPKHEMNVVIGDFSVRLVDKLPHEVAILGEHIFGTHEDRIDLLSEQHKDNRERFLSMCQDKQLVVTNTLFQKDPAKFITYRNPTTLSASRNLTRRRTSRSGLHVGQYKVEQCCNQC